MTYKSDYGFFTLNLKVDVDQLGELAADEGISAMPTFRFYRAGKILGELVGANPTKLEELIIRHSK